MNYERHIFVYKSIKLVHAYVVLGPTVLTVINAYDVHGLTVLTMNTYTPKFCAFIVIYNMEFVCTCTSTIRLKTHVIQLLKFNVILIPFLIMVTYIDVKRNVASNIHFLCESLICTLTSGRCVLLTRSCGS